MADTSDLQSVLDAAHVAPEVFQLRPDYRVLLLAVDGIPPGPSDAGSESLLQAAEAAARESLARQPVTDIPHVAAWRDAYKAFGAKPNKTRNSLEALTRRVDGGGGGGAGGGLPRVNRLTDIYNAVSVKYQIPFGGEDLDKYDGAPFLIRATGTETFETTAGGAPVVERPDVGEVVWCDATGVTCRRWNWRQGPRTALTAESRKVLFILDVLDPISVATLQAAVDELLSALKQISPEIRHVHRTISAPK